MSNIDLSMDSEDRQRLMTLIPASFVLTLLWGMTKWSLMLHAIGIVAINSMVILLLICDTLILAALVRRVICQFLIRLAGFFSIANIFFIGYYKVELGIVCLAIMAICLNKKVGDNAVGWGAFFCTVPGMILGFVISYNWGGDFLFLINNMR